jgi:hypothetical protein
LRPNKWVGAAVAAEDGAGVAGAGVAAVGAAGVIGPGVAAGAAAVAIGAAVTSKRNRSGSREAAFRPPVSVPTIGSDVGQADQ